jgi:hypothetical protein
MKKIVIALLLITMIATPSYAVNILDTILCKKVVLRADGSQILVNRITGEVKYILEANGKWAPLTAGVVKNQCQAMYNAQITNAKKASQYP